MTPHDGHRRTDFRYKEARKRLTELTGEGSRIQAMLDSKGDVDENGFGLVLIEDKHPDTGEEIVYTTTNPDLIHEYCDRLEAQRASG